MGTKKILGLDIGTTSVGGALITLPESLEDFGSSGSIDWMGVRIVPAEGDYLQKYEAGAKKAETKAAARRLKRGSRRLKHRYKLRRTRLIKVFKLLGWLHQDCPLDDPRRIKSIIQQNNGRLVFRISDWLPFSDQTTDEVKQMLHLQTSNGRLPIPEDWIIYYLRKKALREKITCSELARIILLMNQRRGFKSGRKDLEDTEYISIDELLALKQRIDRGELPQYQQGTGEEKISRFVSMTRIIEVKEEDRKPDKSGKKTYTLKAEDPRIQPWQVKRKEKPNYDASDKSWTMVVEQKLNKKGEIKQDKAPTKPEADDWTLTMVVLDNQIANSGKHVGEFFWDNLVEHYKKNRLYKIRQNVVQRARYRRELYAILQKQIELRRQDGTEAEMINTQSLNAIAQMLYPNNAERQKLILERGLVYTLVDDIIYYQRELKSQKKSISECRFEKRIGREQVNGQWETTGVYGLKCAPLSSPLFQEFRIWQDIHNLRMLQREKIVNGKLQLDVDITAELIDDSIKAKLFDLFDSRTDIEEKNIFETLNRLKGTDLNTETHRINLFSNRNTLPGNETKQAFRKIFKKCNWADAGEKLLSDRQALYDLWLFQYSITSSDLDKAVAGIRTALKRRFPDMPQEVREELTKMKEFKKSYAALSSLALRKLLTLMRCGPYWSWNDIEQTRIRRPGAPLKTKEMISLAERINEIIAHGWERQFKIDKRTGALIERKKFTQPNQFSGLPTWLASYIVYGRHSERTSTEKYSAEQIQNLNIPQLVCPGSLRNPLVEKVVRETLHVVREVCRQYGQPNEIHIELSRELKKNAEERARIAEANRANLEEKRRISALLRELINGTFDHYNEEDSQVNEAFSVRPDPDNPADIEKFRIYKSCGTFEYIKEKKANEDQIKLNEMFLDGRHFRMPSGEEIRTYILWLSQRCRSPYTGKIIPLSRLFDETYYEKEHILPRSRIKSDGMDNLVIAETGVNKAKDNQLAAVFIQQANGVCNYGGITYKLLTYDEYVQHCKAVFKGRKLKNLLATEMPDSPIGRELNDTRYISRKLNDLLYPFAKHPEGIIFTLGTITDELKKNWGLNQVWRDLLKPRFERLQQLTGQTYIEYPNPAEPHHYVYRVPEVEDLKLKRLDHRHHALDALIVAVTTREHIRYLNTLNAADSNAEKQRYQRTLCKSKTREFQVPWPSFTQDASQKLHQLIVSFKETTPVVTRPFNRYKKWVRTEEGKLVKQTVVQARNKRWMAVRRSLFKEPQGLVWIKEKKDVPVKDAIRIQILRLQVENDPVKRRTSAYVYDQSIRPHLKQIIQNAIDATGIPLTDTENLLQAIDEQYLKKNKIGKRYRIGSAEYEKVKIAEFTLYKAKRVKLDATFDHKKILEKIPNAENSPVADLLLRHLATYVASKLQLPSFNLKEYLKAYKQLIESGKTPTNEQSAQYKQIEDTIKAVATDAFSEEGLEKLELLNNDRPVRSVTVLDGPIKEEHKQNLFGNKYVEPDKGAIACFVIYENIQTRERIAFESIPSHVFIDRLKKGLPVAEPRPGFRTILLRTGDLVYVPTPEQWQEMCNGNNDIIDWSIRTAISERIYRLVKSTGSQCYFIPATFSTLIIPYGKYGRLKYGELDSQNCSEYTFDGKVKIKTCCIRIRVDRLGNIIAPK